MASGLLQGIVSLPKHIAIAFGYRPWKDDRLVTTSPLMTGRKISSLLEVPNSKQDPSPYYLTWPDSHFAISEYNWEEEHFIELGRLPIGDRLMAKALSSFRNTRPDYANPEVPYESSFSLEDVVTSLRQLVKDEPGFQWRRQKYYVVAYYSTLRADLKPEDYQKLAELDEAAFREALPSKALIRYWFGRPDDLGRNLATCIWTDREDAQMTLAKGPHHRRAASEGKSLYQEGTIDIREYTLTVDQDVVEWSIKLLSRTIHA